VLRAPERAAEVDVDAAENLVDANARSTCAGSATSQTTLFSPSWRAMLTTRAPSSRKR